MSAQPLLAPRSWPNPKVIPGGYSSPDQSRGAAKAPLHATLPGLQHFPRSSWLVWAGSAVIMLLLLTVAGTLRSMNVAANLEVQSLNHQILATQDQTIALQRQYRTQVRERNDRALLVSSDGTLMASGSPLTVTMEPIASYPTANPASD